MKISVEQRSSIKRCVLNGMSRKEVMTLLEKAYGNNEMKNQQCMSGKVYSSMARKRSTTNRKKAAQSH